MSYHTVFELRSLCLRENLSYDIKSRIGCQAQMEKFDFLFSFNLGYRLYSITDSLSNALQQQQQQQQQKSAVSDQHLAPLTAHTLEKMSFTTQ